MLSAFLAAHVAGLFGVTGDKFPLETLPAADVRLFLLILLLAVSGAVCSGLFCILLRGVRKVFLSRIRNIFLRILAASAVFIALTAVVGNRDYCGTGAGLMAAAMTGGVPYAAFLLKMLFTAVTLGGGFKGGEIGPSLSVGACLGAAFGNVFGISPALCAACGMLSLFSGVTNCPVASLFLGFELFGTEGILYFAVTVALSFAMSGYYGLYSSQKFTYSKTKTEFINRKAN